MLSSTGITSDAPISYIARHNLMQVAQILQVLAISSSDIVDPRQNDLYNKFDKVVFAKSGCITIQFLFCFVYLSFDPELNQC